MFAEFLDHLHMRVTRLSALRSDLLYPHKIFLVRISEVDSKERIKPMKKIPKPPSEIEPAVSDL
jgi:hypothetical protein